VGVKVVRMLKHAGQLWCFKDERKPKVKKRGQESILSVKGGERSLN